MSRLFAFRYAENTLGGKFNYPLNSWDVSNVTNMSGMFDGALYNQPLSSWDVSNVTDMSRMFAGSKFNQPIGNWNVSSVTDMLRMFSTKLASHTGCGISADFNQDISSWDVRNIINYTDEYYLTIPCSDSIEDRFKPNFANN